MTRQEFIRLAEQKIIRLDGATGTELIKRGLPAGVCPEEWCVRNPAAITDVQQSYCRSGSDLLYVPSFGANPAKLAEFNLEGSVRELNIELVRISRSACPGKLIFGDIAPTGHLIEPNGPLPFEEAVKIYRTQAEALLEGGVDGFAIETMMDLQEARAALIAIKDIAPEIAVIVTMTFEPGGRTLTGTDPVSALVTFQSLGAAAFGCNCSTGPEEMAQIIRKIKPYAAIPLAAKPNAGMPRLVGDKTVFPQGPEEFGKAAALLAEAGASLIGGCCGTSPAHIASLNQELVNCSAPVVCQQIRGVAASAQNFCVFGAQSPFVLIGERINPTGKKALQAELRENKFDLVRQFALEQSSAGAAVLDVNVGVGGIDQTSALRRAVAETVKTVQLPLAIDSTLPEAVEAALRFYPGRAVLNSISAEKERIEKILPIAAKYGALPILLPLSDDGVPTTAQKRIELLNFLLDEVKKYNYEPADCIADALIMTISTDCNAALEALNFIDYCTNTLGIATTCGLSNISFGLPDRAALNLAFLGLACGRGLSSAIANPGAAGIVSTIDAANALRALDPGLKNYIARHANAAKTESKVVQENLPCDQQLKAAVVNSLPDSVEKAVQNALDAGFKADYLVNDILIPALTEVGSRFERKEYFLPQLMQSAEAMRLAMAALEPELKKDRADNAAGPVFVLATVEGDIHDIGKNIVNMLLGNHGFKVIDLGKDVPAQAIIDAAKEHNAVCIGLSALMTTTMPRMREVVELLKENNISLPVIVGGAAVDSGFAEEIGAVYASDAMAAVRAVQNLVNAD